jgi:hypothetical protein
VEDASVQRHGAYRALLSAVRDALTLPPPALISDERAYLELLRDRAHLTRQGLARLAADPDAGPLDFDTEARVLRELLADLPPDTYRHSGFAS